MAIEISRYVDPGTYIGEVIQPGSVSLTSDRVLAIVGIAPRTRRSSNEAVIRGKIYEESLALAASTPHIAQLVNVCNRDRNNATLYMNGNELGIADWSFLPAYLSGLEWAGATVDVSSGGGNQYLTLSMDRLDVVTIDMDAAVTAIGGTPATATPDDICDAINYELGNVAGTYYSKYGSAYVGVATHATGVTFEVITLTSPVTTSSSDVKVFLSMANDAASTISNAGWVPTASAGVQADTWVQVRDESYSSVAAYTLDYVAVDGLTDPLVNATAINPLDNIVRIGSYPNGTSYAKNLDYLESGNNVDWTSATWANATITGLAGPYNIVASTNDKFYFAINDNSPILIPLTAGAARTAAQVAVDINTALNASALYGPEFSHVASDSGGSLKLDVPDPFENFPTEKGVGSSFDFLDTSNNAFATLFGVITLPFETRGVGSRPAFGTGYYVTYDYQRPSEDYETYHRVYDPGQLYEYTSPLTLGNYTRNALCVSGEISFENSTPSIFVVQVNDSTMPGQPTLNQIRRAIDVCEETDAITDVVVLDTSQEIAAYLMDHVSNQSSILEKHYRRGWYGMARDTDPGDPDTPDTFVYRSTQTLQPGAKSPGRGRQILVAGGNATRTLTLESGQEVSVDLDGSYIAAAVASVFTALPSPASPLINKTITGFEESGFSTFLRGERWTMASQGVTVVTLQAGRFLMLDPLTTEAGGGGVVQFEEPAASAQKDAVSRTVERLITANMVGVVPDDLADFISDTKKWILLGIEANINAGSIGPYRDSAGFPREIDALTDIQVAQSTTDPRNFYFKYWFNLRYPAKRFFGEYSVDNPFFSPA